MLWNDLIGVEYISEVRRTISKIGIDYSEKVVDLGSKSALQIIWPNDQVVSH